MVTSLVRNNSKLFDKFFDTFSALDNSLFESVHINMPVDVYKTEDEYIVRAELPGFTRDQVDLKIDKDILSITASRSVENHNWQVVSSEIVSREKRERKIQFGRALDAEKINASLKDGILEIHLPILSESKARRIEIKD